MAALSKPPAMAPREFRAARAALRWSVRGIADQLGVSASSVRQWEDGETRVPEAVGQWICALVTCQARHPAPSKAGKHW